MPWWRKLLDWLFRYELPDADDVLGMTNVALDDLREYDGLERR